MKKILTLPLLSILLIGAGCARPVAAPPAPATDAPAAATASSGDKFADQPYYQNSYLISSDTLTPDARSALSGFKMTKTGQPDGTTRITLEAIKPGYKTQQYDLKPGEQLYFIEKYLQDDDPVKDEDKNLMDDQAVVVDAAGNVVRDPAGWTR